MKEWLFFISALLPVIAYGQRPIFSQYYSNGLYLNPALASLESERVAHLHYRSQWTALGMPFKTMQASYIHPIYRDDETMNGAGAGISFFRDVSGSNGEFINNGINGAYAYNFEINRSEDHILSIGGQLGYYVNRIDTDNFQWSSQYDDVIGYNPTLPGEPGSSDISKSYLVINMGALWRYKTSLKVTGQELDFYNGFAVENINKPNTSVLEGSEARLYRLYKAHGGAAVYITREFKISPNYLIRFQNNIVQTNVGANGAYKLSVKSGHVSDVEMILGAWYRFGDSFIINTGFTTSRFNFAFSYDINNSSFSTFNSGRADAYEISLAVKFPSGNRHVRFSSPII